MVKLPVSSDPPTFLSFVYRLYELLTVKIDSFAFMSHTSARSLRNSNRKSVVNEALAEGTRFD